MINFGFKWSWRNSLAFPENGLNLDNQKFAQKKKKKKKKEKYYFQKFRTFFGKDNNIL